jgi:hypothetical protein
MHFEKPNHMTAEFNHVLTELDFGQRAAATLRYGYAIDCIEALIAAKSDLVQCNLQPIPPYDQLRLYFVTEWLEEFGLLNLLVAFKQADFQDYFLNKLDHVYDGTVTITAHLQERDELPCHPYMVVIHAHALTSETLHDAIDDANPNGEDVDI